jgi:hypothetical protein
MSTNPANTGRRKAVIAPATIHSQGVNWPKIIPVWILSTVVHGAIVGLAFLLFSLLGNLRAATLDEPEVVATTRIEDQKEDLDPTVTEPGMDGSMPFSIPSARIEDVIVPVGHDDITQPAGIENAPADALRRTVPLPPGAGEGPGGALPGLDGLAIGQPGSGAGMGGLDLRDQFIGRSPATRTKTALRGGGSPESERRVALGLEWLALHQAQDGHWSLHECNHFAREKSRPAGKVFQCNCECGTTQRSDVAATAFGLLPFLGAGITHRAGITTYSKDYSKTVEGAVNWLMSKQGKDGSYTTDMYAHGIAAIAMCEAYGLTSDPRIKQSAQRSLNFIAAAQDPAGGGWRYRPRMAGDISVTGWQLMALKSGQMAGLTVPKNTLKASDHFLDACEIKSGKDSTSSRQGGGYGYLAGGNDETITRTSIGLLCRMYSGVGPGNPSLLAGVQKLKAVPPEKNSDIYYLYYATQVMHHMQGDSWRFWNTGVDEKGQKVSKGIRDFLISKQDTGSTPKRPHQLGSWGGSAGGRVMATSLSLLCLEVYYRHLPLYRRDLNFNKENK